MHFIAPSPLSVLAFLGIVVCVLAAFVGATYLSYSRHGSPGAKRSAQLAFGLLVWLALFSGLVGSGFVQAAPMPRLMLLFGFVNLGSLAFAFSPLAGAWASAIPLSWLVAFQGFRLPLELVLHEWAKQGTIPLTMTWQGANLDIVTGVSSLLLAPFVGRYRALAWLANVSGIALLLNVMRVAVLSSPLPFAWQVEPPLQLGFHLPYAWIVPVCVGGALVGHVVLFRALLRRR